MSAARHAAHDLAVGALRVDAALAGDDEVGVCEQGVEAHHVEHDLDAAAQFRAQQSDAARAERARRAGSGEHGDRGVQLAAEGLVQRAELTVQLAHGCLVRALLRRENARRAAMAVHGIGDVAHGDHAHTVKPFARGGGVDVRDAVERRADGNEGPAARVREADAQRRGAAAAAVVRGAAAEAEHDAPRAARKRVGDELSDAVGRGDTGIFASGNERESRCRGHFNDRRAVRQQGVGCVDRLAVGILHAGDEHALAAAGIEEAIHRPLAAVRHAQRADLAGGKVERDTLARDGADVAARQRALEGIGDHDALFHALCLPCGCFSYSICKPRAGCKSFPPQR